MWSMVVTQRAVGSVAHWCSRCASLQPFALVHELLEGRLFRVVPVGRGQVKAAIGQCLGCGNARPLSPERFPRGSAVPPTPENLDALVTQTNPAVAAQRARLDALCERMPPSEVLTRLGALLGHPQAEALLALAEANDARLAVQLEAAQRGVDVESRIDELVRSIAASYPSSAGLFSGFLVMVALLAPAWLLHLPWWGWAALALAGGALARTVIGRVRDERVATFTRDALAPALARESVSHEAFYAAIARYRNGGPGATASLQDMANDQVLIARSLQGARRTRR
jgi:hypothetical protein